MGLVFVDCEAYGGSPSTGNLTEFGAVTWPDKKTFHGIIFKTRPSVRNPAIPDSATAEPINKPGLIFLRFANWLQDNVKGRPVFISDNVAYDWQWINDGFWKYCGRNPFGHSGRRISDFYAGVMLDFHNTQDWKRYRKTPHDHNPVNDAMGNVEAFEKILELVKQRLARAG